MYYNYHGIIKKKIKENKLIKIEFVEKYKNIKNVMLLYFNDGTIYPIREHRFLEYSIFLNQINDIKKDSWEHFCLKWKCSNESFF